MPDTTPDEPAEQTAPLDAMASEQDAVIDALTEDLTADPFAGDTDDITANQAAARAAAAHGRRFDLLRDVDVEVTVELGRTHMAVKDILAVAPGTLIELDRAVGSPVDVLVNGTAVARGKVVVLDDEFGVRISEIITLDV